MKPIWKGHISFGLVNIPMALYSAVNHTEVRFHLVDSRNDARVRYERVNEETGDEVPWANVVKAYEFDDENFVVLKNDEIKNVLDEGKQLINIEEFIPMGKIPDIFFEKPYYLVPTNHGEKGYFLLKEALLATKTIAVAKVVIRTREYLAALLPYDDGLMLNLLYFPQEIKSFKELDLMKDLKTKPTIVKKELDLAISLIDSMKTTWTPKKYHDSYREALMKIIQEKIKTGKVHAIHEKEEATPTKVVDFMKLLQQSMDKKPAKKKSKNIIPKKKAPAKKSNTRK